MAKTTAAEQRVKLRINCLNPPRYTPDDPLEFGLQDKDQRVYAGMAQADDSLRFECDVEVKRSSDGSPNFLGAFAHGTPTDRFLYLTWKHRANGRIAQRIKVRLAAITWVQVEAALAGKRLEASIEATRTGSVPLLGEGWQVADS